MTRKSQRILLIVLLFIVVLLEIGIVYMFYTTYNSKPSAGIDTYYNGSYIDKIAKKAIPAVVYIQSGDRSGSGVIVSNNGHIITNSHVIGNGKDVSVRLSDKRIFRASAIGSDVQTDVALLKINSSELPNIEFGDSDAIDVGDDVIAIGNPFGFDFTVTKGIISAKNREKGPTEYKDFLQTDASINPGNSGGPLIGMDGKLIGITTFIVSDIRSGELGFAIPSNLVKIIMNRLIKYGRIDRSYLGVSLRDIVIFDENTGVGRIVDGAEIVSFDPHGPATNAGLREKDIITEINSVGIENTNQLRNYVAWIPVGETIDVRVLRDNKEMAFKLKTVLRPNF